MQNEKADVITDTEIIWRLTEIVKAQADLIRGLRDLLKMHGIECGTADQIIKRTEDETNGIIGEL